MGSYNSQYESYYGNMLNRNRGRSFNGPSFHFDKKKLLRRLIQELVGGAILFIFVAVCKMNIFPYSKAAYTYSKNIVKQDFDYQPLINNMNSLAAGNFDINSVQTDVANWIENIKDKLTGGKSVKETVKSDFMLPLNGKIIASASVSTSTITNMEVNIDAKTDGEVKSCYEGKVKDAGTDKKLGKYILIDNGNGIETKFSNLTDVLVKKGDSVKKGQVIAKIDNKDKTKSPYLNFQLLYMGENVNPQDYMNFTK